MYRQKSSLEYVNRRKWLAGYRSAMNVARRLENQGWTVERGALTQKQTERTIKDLKREGYETQAIPVTQLNGEPVQFIAYKPKPGAPPPQPKPKKKTRRTTTKDPTEEFLKIFWRGHKDKDEPDDGVLMDPARMAAVVPKDASPQQSSGKQMVKLVEESVQQAEKMEPLDYSKFLKAEKIGKMTKKPQKYVSFGSPSSCYSIDVIKKAMRVLGSKKETEAYYRADQPLIIRHKETGHSVIIAPTQVEASDPQVVSISTVQAL